MRRFAAVLLVFTACAGTPSGPADRARQVEGRVWSPYCPGRLLIDCTTEQARALRGEIERRFDTGQTTDEVLAWIEDNHGSEALAVPAASGSGLAIWAVPIAALLAGAVIVVGVVRRWSRGTVSSAEPPAPRRLTPEEQAELIERVRDEVRRDL